LQLHFPPSAYNQKGWLNREICHVNRLVKRRGNQIEKLAKEKGLSKKKASQRERLVEEDGHATKKNDVEGRKARLSKHKGRSDQVTISSSQPDASICSHCLDRNIAMR
jgi:hypothetical protein